MDEQKAKSRQSWKGSGDALIPESVKAWKQQNLLPTFTGYELTSQGTNIKAISTTEDPRILWVCVDPCPFYPTGGGQVGDKGSLVFSNNTTLKVVDTIRPYEGGIALKVEDDENTIEGLRIIGALNTNSTVKAGKKRD
jgi:alanyl-tRNA synthetase